VALPQSTTENHGRTVTKLRSYVPSRQYERLLREEAERFLAGRADRWRAGGTGIPVRTASAGSPSAVAVAVGRIPDRVERIGVGFVPDDEGRAALRFAGAVATRCGAGLRAIPVEVLARASSELDLMVCGSHGHGPLGQVVLDSTPHGLLAVAGYPVLLVPRVADEDEPQARDSQSRSLSA
jgi:nucleotide-binding universal stress UspA family protein